MKLRSILMMALSEHIRRNELNQSQAARLFGVTQPRISDIKRGKINLFSLDSLVKMAVTAGLRVELTVSELEAT